MIMRCHQSLNDRRRTRDFGVRMLAFVNIPPGSLSCKLGRRAPGAGVAPAKPNTARLKFRFRASPCINLLYPFDAAQNSSTPMNPLVSCIDAERAAI